MNKWIRLLLLGVALAFLVWVSAITQGVYFGMRIVRWFYDIGAKVYDRVKNNNLDEDADFVGRPLVERLMTAAGNAGSLRVLDVATGTGRLPMTLLERTEFTGNIVGVDFSAVMLEMAAQKLAIHRERVALVHGLAEPLAFPDHTFDGVVLLEALELMVDMRAVIREMIRVLRPGGWLALTNRVGPTARFMPGQVLPTAHIIAFLADLGLTEIECGEPKYYWGIEYYVLIFAHKP